MATPTPPAAASAPVAAIPKCDRPGCGMPATGSVQGLNHCENHRDWMKGADNNDVAVLRAKRAGGEI